MAAFNPNPEVTMLSNGPINATINTYKPDSISFINGGTITIIFDGNIIATIHVTQDSNPKTLSTYILTGDTDSLTMFETLCNKYISNKSPFLRFNGEPAAIPVGFEVSEADKDDKPFYPPTKMSMAQKKSIKEGIQSQRRYDFKSIMDSLEEAEREPTSGESGAAARPPNTIFLLVSMHGARLECDSMRLSKDLPKNETYAYAPGQCPILKVSTMDQIARIKKYRGLNVDKILNGYAQDIPDADRRKIGRYSVLYDQHYQCDALNNANVFSNGIFVLGSNFLDPAVFDPVEIEGRMEVEYSQFHTTQYEPKSAMELQKINLINVHVLEELSHRVTRTKTKFALKPQPRGPYFSITKDDTGLTHYFNSKLSDYLTYCQELGAEKVVVLDETCRIRSFRQCVGAEEREAAEDEFGPGFLMSRPFAPGEIRGDHDRDYGGRRTKRKRTKRRRSRRFHKKS